MNYEVRFAAGIEAKSPKCVTRCVDGLVANSPAAAQKDLQLRTYHLLLRTFYSIQLDEQTTTKYYSHV